jgi:hypothetical protein
MEAALASANDLLASLMQAWYRQAVPALTLLIATVLGLAWMIWR